MAGLKPKSAGRQLVTVDTSKAPNVLTVNNVNRVSVAFQIQVYGENNFGIKPSQALLPPLGGLDCEMFGGKPAEQNFHVVALAWPATPPKFDQTVWRKLEKRDKQLEQVISFGHPPAYAGIKQDFSMEPGSAKSDASSASSKGGESKSSGPAMLISNLQTISFKPPQGKVQMVPIKLRNNTTKPAAFKIMTNRGPYYQVKPSRGILDTAKSVTVEVEMTEMFTKKDYETDNKGHEIHVMAIKWPKKVEEYHHDEWKRLEKARKDQRQRLVIAVNHQGKENAGDDAETKAKSSAQLTAGPALVEVTPKRIFLTPPLNQSHKLTLTSNHYSVVAYKLMTNKPKFYVVNPNKGTIKPDSKVEAKIEVNENLHIQDFQDAENHQLLLVAVDWPHNPNTFDQEKFAILQKTKKKDMQRLCIDVELEVASKNTFVTAFPPVLSFKPPNGMSGQTLTTTIVNKAQKPVAFKVDPCHDSLLKAFKVEPDSGVVKQNFGAKVTFTLKASARRDQMPDDPTLLAFKVMAVDWHLGDFNEAVWKEYLGMKKDEMQTMRIRFDFDAVDEKPADEEATGAQPAMPQGQADQMMMMALMQQLQQMQAMQGVATQGAMSAMPGGTGTYEADHIP